MPTRRPTTSVPTPSSCAHPCPCLLSGPPLCVHPRNQSEFEHAILEDLEMLRIKPDQVTWTSDWFEQILQYAEIMIKSGKAYVDETPVEQVRRTAEQAHWPPGVCRAAIVG